MNRLTETLCIITLTVSLILACSMLAPRLAPAPPPPDVSAIEAKLDAIMLERGLALTPCETPVPMVPEEVR